MNEGEGLQVVVYVYICLYIRVVYMYTEYIWHIDIPGLPSSTGNSSVPSSTNGMVANMANPAVLIFSSDDRAVGHREATLRPRELIRLHSMDAEGLHGRRIETNPPCYALMVTKGHGLDDTPLPSRSP